jgi:excisionase family DNA binding protein
MIFSAQEAAAFIKVSTSTLYRYVATKRIKYYRKGRKLFFFWTDLIEFIKSGNTCEPLKPIRHAQQSV